MKTYTAEEARPLILNGSLKGEYAVTGFLDLSRRDLTSVTLPVEVVGSLSLRGCDITGATLPVKVVGSLDLIGCVLTGATLPIKVDGRLDLSRCDLTGATLPVEVGGSLYLSRCDLTGATLPAEVGGSLSLRGCDLTGVTLPTKVGGWLDLSNCANPDPSQCWRERGQSVKRHCLAISVYALIETEDGFYSAGCRGPWTAGQALAHWGPRSDERAKIFTAAIKANEERKSK